MIKVIDNEAQIMCAKCSKVLDVKNGVASFKMKAISEDVTFYCKEHEPDGSDIVKVDIEDMLVAVLINTGTMLKIIDEADRYIEMLRREG